MRLPADAGSRSGPRDLPLLRGPLGGHEDRGDYAVALTAVPPAVRRRQLYDDVAGVERNLPVFEHHRQLPGDDDDEVDRLCRVDVEARPRYVGGDATDAAAQR